jgi:hypothetical protein
MFIKTQVQAKCPFYFELEEKFLSRAGIKPAATNYGVLNSDDSDADFDSNVQSDAEGGVDEEEGNSLSVTTPANKRKKKQNKTSTKKTPKAARQSGDVLEESLAKLIDATMKTKKDAERQQKDSGAEIAALASNFKVTADALGGRVAAAAAYHKFKMFLTRDEKRELEELQTNSEESDNE